MIYISYSEVLVRHHGYQILEMRVQNYENNWDTYILLSLRIISSSRLKKLHSKVIFLYMYCIPITLLLKGKLDVLIRVRRRYYKKMQIRV